MLKNNYFTNTIRYGNNMELIERIDFLNNLQNLYKNMIDGEGHTIFISGEAGIGKTSLVKSFCKDLKNKCFIYQGTCDALFTPRPLAPIYDIAFQIENNPGVIRHDIKERNELFTRLFNDLQTKEKPIIIVFEDIHWADEATIDFIKFFARRVTQLQCLFIITYRDDEIHSYQSVRNMLGQLPADSFTRLQLVPLSRSAVEKMANAKGYNADYLYSISDGNPFYVNEILAHYSPGIPDNIKDSILSVYHRQEEKIKEVWEILSVIPTGFEISYLQKMEPSYIDTVEVSIAAKILIIKKDLIFFKHELYRRTIEASLSPQKRIAINKRVLHLFLKNLEQNDEIERIIHHAKNANDSKLVVHYAPLAAKKAASLGAHVQASKLYFTAIEYYTGEDEDLLVEFYELYAYECYLINQIKEAIAYQKKSLKILLQKNNLEKTGNCMRFLSRLLWLVGNRKEAESFQSKAIDILNDQPPSTAKALAFSNMSQLKRLSDQSDESIYWGEKAISLAYELNDTETLCHALNNYGNAQINISSFNQKGFDLLKESLAIALENSYHEHAARAYTNLSSSGVIFKNYSLAEKSLKEGIQYCEERNLRSWQIYMLSWQARLLLETGKWDEAYHIAENMLTYENQWPIGKIATLTVVAIVKMRRGHEGALPLLLKANKMAFETMELQRIFPPLFALLEYEWIMGENQFDDVVLDRTIKVIKRAGKISNKNKFYYWLNRSRKQHPLLDEVFDTHDECPSDIESAASWKDLGCRYEEALALFEGTEADKRKAINIVHELGADAVYKKMKQEMRSSGIRSIPHGARKTTLSNAALLTGREMEVLQLLKDGMHNKEIATKLFISTKTVDNHISSILFKLDVNSRSKAIQKAAAIGIL